MNEPIMSLSTIAKHETIELESKRHPKGKLYDLANLADLGPYEYAVILEQNEITKPLLGKKLTPKMERVLVHALDTILKLIIPKLEPTVLAELTKEQKSSIVMGWSIYVANVTDGAAEGNARSNRQTTSASSPRSRSRTAATRRRGSTGPRGS